MNRYIVFMKQVPLSTKIDMNPETKTLKRSSALAQVNPDDLHALQCALDLKKLTGAEVVDHLRPKKSCARLCRGAPTEVYC